jgi:hypothetical protein
LEVVGSAENVSPKQIGEGCDNEGVITGFTVTIPFPVDGVHDPKL